MIQQEDRLPLRYMTSLFFFFLAAILGVFMRWAFVDGLPDGLNYRHIMHAHSHTAMLGWLYLGLFALVVRVFLEESVYLHWLFVLSAVAVGGQFIGFLMDGYGVVAIASLTVHLILTYAFIAYTWKKLRKERRRKSVIFLMAALVFLGLSTLGLWGLPFFISADMKGSAQYYASIQFFLHFQFNGWFIFCVLALFVRMLEKKNLPIDTGSFQKSFILLSLSCLMTYALAVTWSTPRMYIFAINSVGVVLQLGGWYFLQKWMIPSYLRLHSGLPDVARRLWGLSFVSFSLKIVVQTAVAWPVVAEISYTIHNFVIGFIHLIMLGILTFFIIGLYEMLVDNNGKMKYGLYLLVVGVIASEVVLFGQGLLLWINCGFLPYYYHILFYTSIFMPMGILMYGLSIFGRPSRMKIV